MAPTVPSLRPTRRGLAVVAVAVGAFALGVTGGARSLNAVVVPALIALGAAAVQLHRADAPTVERTTPEPGFAGERRRVTVSVDSDVPCTLSERVADALDGDPDRETVGHGGGFEYEIGYRRRGEHVLGPADCVQTDSLGLFYRRVEAADSGASDARAATALVYPDIYDLDADITGLVGSLVDDDRSSFERLREYTPDDSMRDIHWRASAKRADDEFLVAEYGSRGTSDEVTVVGESAPDAESADAMAAAVASVAARLHEAGATAVVRVPGGDLTVPPGRLGDLLELLARTDGGRVEVDGPPEIAVRAESGRATVSLSDREVGFEADGEGRGREALA